MGKIVFKNYLTIQYGSHATLQFEVKLKRFSDTGDVRAVPGTISIANTLITLDEKDVMSVSSILKKIQNSTIPGFSVNWDGYSIYANLIADSSGPLGVPPVVTLGTAQNIFINSYSFTDGTVPQAPDDILVEGSFPVLILVNSMGATAKLYESTGSDLQQEAGTLPYTEITDTTYPISLSSTTRYIKCLLNGASSATLTLKKMPILAGGGGGDGTPGKSPEFQSVGNVIYWRLEGDTTWIPLIDIVEGSMWTKRVDTVGDIIYIGEAEVGSLESSPVWRISRTEFLGDDVVILWANGDALFTKVWNNRLSLSYS